VNRQPASKEIRLRGASEAIADKTVCTSSRKVSGNNLVLDINFQATCGGIIDMKTIRFDFIQ